MLEVTKKEKLSVMIRFRELECFQNLPLKHSMLNSTEGIFLKRHQERFELRQEGEISSLLQANPSKEYAN